MVQLRILSRSHDKIGLFVTNVKSNSSSIGNLESLLGIGLGMCGQLLGIELGMCVVAGWHRTRDVWAVAGH